MMKIYDYIDNKSEWLKGDGPQSDIVMSTRIRVARNLDGFPFFEWAEPSKREDVLNAVFSVIEKSKTLDPELILRMKDTTDLERAFLVERHLISKEHSFEVANKGLVVGNGETLSIMVNEEDHLRIQVLKSGFNISEAWRDIEAVDQKLSETLKYAFSNKFGYLTACPTNTGTGLRSSVMLHLPALELTNQIEKVYEAISKVGFTIRGFYGEGSEASGNFFQISNQVALGHSEMDLLDNFTRVVEKIIDREKETRDFLLTGKKKEITDNVCRSLGTLQTARIITSRETIKLLSSIRLGVDLGLLKDVDTIHLNEILLLMQPAHLQVLNNAELNSNERDIRRADLVRDKLRGSGDECSKA